MSVVINIAANLDAKDLDRAQRELDKLGKKVKGQESKVQSMGRTFTAAGGIVAAAVGSQMIGQVVDFAAKLEGLNRTAETTQRKFDTVFGEMAAEMYAFADANNEAFGVSETSMQGFLASIQDILIPLGFARDEAAEMTGEIATLANALQEFTPGTTIEQAVGALTSALTGEREQLKQFGVVLKEADINARLAEKGLSGLTGEALKQAKAQATLELATELAGDALDAYSERGGTAEAQTKEMAAAAADAAESIAETLAPEIQALKEDAAEITLALGYWADEMGEAERGSESFFQALERQYGVFGAIGNIIPGVSLGMDWFRRKVDEANEAVRNQEQGQQIANDRIAAMQGAAQDSADALDDELSPSMDDAGAGAEEMSTAFQDAADKMAEAWDDAVDDLAGSIGEMPGIFDEANDDSLKSVEEFIADVDREFRFIQGLDTLIAMGLDDVAAQFADRGYSEAALAALDEFLARPLEDQLAMEDEIAAAEQRRNEAVAESVKRTAANEANAARWEGLGEYWAQRAEDGFNDHPWKLNLPDVKVNSTPSGPDYSVGLNPVILHDGGVVPGRPGSEVLTLLEAGETVIPRSGAADSSGRPLQVNIVMDGQTIASKVLNELTVMERRGTIRRF